MGKIEHTPELGLFANVTLLANSDPGWVPIWGYDAVMACWGAKPFVTRVAKTVNSQFRMDLMAVHAVFTRTMCCRRCNREGGTVSFDKREPMLNFIRYPEREFTRFEVEPETPFSEWLHAIKSYEKAGVTRHELYDLRRMTVTPDEGDIERVIRHDQHMKTGRPVGSKTAIVISNAKEHWLVRLYSTLANVVEVNWQTHAFFTIEEAEAWLGIASSETSCS